MTHLHPQSPQGFPCGWLFSSQSYSSFWRCFHRVSETFQDVCCQTLFKFDIYRFTYLNCFFFYISNNCDPSNLNKIDDKGLSKLLYGAIVQNRCSEDLCLTNMENQLVTIICAINKCPTPFYKSKIQINSNKLAFLSEQTLPAQGTNSCVNGGLTQWPTRWKIQTVSFCFPNNKHWLQC